MEGSSSIAVAVARTGVSGVRSSWLRVARKRSFARLADSASTRAARSSKHADPLLGRSPQRRDVAQHQYAAEGVGTVLQRGDPRIEHGLRGRSRTLELESLFAYLVAGESIREVRPAVERPGSLIPDDLGVNRR